MLTADPLTMRALTFVTPEAFFLLDPDLPPGRPRYFTTYQGHLWLYPEPDAAYQLDHKCFVAPVAAADLNGLPEPFAQASLFGALALALQSQGRLRPMQQLQAMASALAQYLGVLYYPTQQDTQQLTKPPR